MQRSFDLIYGVLSSAANDPSVFTITEKAPTRAFSWLKATIKTLC